MSCYLEGLVGLAADAGCAVLELFSEDPWCLAAGLGDEICREGEGGSTDHHNCGSSLKKDRKLRRWSTHR